MVFFLKPESSLLASGHMTTVSCFPDAVAAQQLSGSSRPLLRVRCHWREEQQRDMYTRTAVKGWAEPRRAFRHRLSCLGTSEMTRLDLRC